MGQKLFNLQFYANTYAAPVSIENKKKFGPGFDNLTEVFAEISMLNNF